jgi:hypothetical protein
MTSVAFQYWQDELWPSAMSVWSRLDIPAWDEYQPVLRECGVDVWKAGRSTAQLSVLTLRPIAILCWMILEVVWEVAQVLFRVLLSQGWIQLKKGLIQLKAAAIWFYHFQMSLSRTEILGEVALVGFAVGLYYLYRWIRRQTYWQRFMKWFADKKQGAIEVRVRDALLLERSLVDYYSTGTLFPLLKCRESRRRFRTSRAGPFAFEFWDFVSIARRPLQCAICFF